MPIKEKAHLSGGPIPNAVLVDKSEETTNRLKLQRRRGGRASRDKGNRAERAIVKFLQERGFAAERVPLSGSAGGSYLGDLTVPILNVDRVVEVKCRADGFRELYRWLIDRDILIVRADRSEPLVSLPLKLAAEIAAKAAGHE
jgi:hypothetical protein